MAETSTPKLPPVLHRQRALKAAWKPLLLNWVVPGWGFWSIGEKKRAKAYMAVWAVFSLLAFLQLYLGAADGVRGGVYVPTRESWLQTLGALGTLGVGPIYGIYAWLFGGASTEPVRNLTQEYGATYVMVAGLLNWLCCFDLFDRVTGRWHWRLPKDERIEFGLEEAEEAAPEA